jgi:heat shock protein HtpX
LNQTTWLARRALLAIALMIGFYVLALGIAAALVFVPFAAWNYLGQVYPKLALGCVVSAIAIVWAVLPRPDRFEPPGPKLDDASHPELLAAVRDVASATSQAMPADVFLVNDVNAWVTQRGGIMGFGSHRVMGLGLPLLQGLTVSEFKSVLAHEFGHYAAGDVKLGPWIYKTRSAIGRAIAHLDESWLSGIFKAYGKVFLRLTHAISRQQEFLADAVAARAIHPTAMASALRKTEGLAPAFASYWSTEVGPALNAGCLPPLTKGFHQFLSSATVSEAVGRLVQISEAEGESDAFDTHPPLRERLAALTTLTAGAAKLPDNRPATVLLRNPESDALSLLTFAAGVEACTKLRRIEWNQLATEVYPTQWRETTQEHATFLAKYTADTLPSGAREFSEAGRPLSPSGEAQLRAAFAVNALSVAVAVALLDAGAVPDNVPGHPICFRTSSASMEPFVAIAHLADGSLSLDDWKAQCVAMGIAGKPLAPVAAA